MSVFQGVKVNRLNGGLGRRNPSDDGVVLLIVKGAVGVAGLGLNEPIELLSLNDAESIGVTASYDDTNSILAHYHIDEFFKYSPDGNLFIVLADSMFDADALKEVVRNNDSIRGIGVVRNTSILEPDLITEIASYQSVVNELRAESILLDFVFLEGAITSDSTLVSAYTDLRSLSAPNVSVVICQDPVIRSLKAEYSTHGAIGTALGMISVRNVNENLGSVDIESKPDFAKGSETYPLTNPARKRWTTSVLQNGKNINSLTQNDKTSLDEKGYVFAGSYVGSADYFFNNSNTCVEFASDYAYIENNRVWNKAARSLRKALLPRVKSNLLKDPDTGFIKPIAAKELENIGGNALKAMEASEEISGYDVFIDPKQILNQNTPLKIKAQIVANNIIFDIEFDLGLTNKI